MSTPAGRAPLVAFDLETTGARPLTDRVVAAAVVTRGIGDDAPRTWLLDPGIPIPLGATAVHGITTERARAEGLEYRAGLTQIAEALAAAVDAGAAVVAFNAAFDLSMLHHELQRNGLPSAVPSWPVVDPMVLDRRFDKYRRGKRTLSDVTAHYGVELLSAHEAHADAVAAGDLAQVMLERFELTERLIDELTADQQVWYREHAEDFAAYLRRKADETDGSDRARLLARADAVSTQWPVEGV